MRRGNGAGGGAGDAGARSPFPEHRLLKYLRTEILPTPFCPGCGCGTVLNTFAQAVDELRLDPKELVFVTGIGCSSWIPSPYFRGDTLHTTHGRAVAFATGVKVMRPELKVVIIAGDGDLAGIGGNHLIHAARRNIDLSVFMVNNWNYGMTGGQVSPATPYGVPTTTTPYRNPEHPLRAAELVAAAGAAYVARWTTYHVFPLMESMEKALQVKGFSFVEILSQCPVSYGKLVKMREAADFLELYRERSVRVEKARTMDPAELEERFVVGKLAEHGRPEFGETLRRINAAAAAAAGEEG